MTEAAETPGTHYAYSYDDAGNRTGVWLNGTRVLTRTFDAADQVVGYTYDAAGNLTNDGTTTYTYDALNRLTQRGTTYYTYNPDGVLLMAGTTRYVPDLAAPLNQVLAMTDGVTTTDYLYGVERLAAVRGGTQTWYSGDALGSVRQTLNDAGAVLGSLNYDPWGTVESGTVPTFGFTGEVQDAASGLVYLRARWYSTLQGRFISRDPVVGVDIEPYSLHPYQYAYSNPALNTDPSGNRVCDLPEQIIVRHVGYHGYQRAYDDPTGEGHNYIAYCNQQRERLNTIYGIDKNNWHNGFEGLINLFTDSNLPGGAEAERQGFRQRKLSHAAERLEFVLWYFGTGFNTHAHFNDEGFAEEFRDSGLWTDEGNPWQSPQPEHFLTAVRFAYDSTNLASDYIYKACMIGHEVYGESAPDWMQCLNLIDDGSVCWFDRVISADESGRYSDRDRLLREIDPYLPEFGNHGPLSKDPHRGGSMQDLRLSVKGWIFGKKIRNGELSDLQAAQIWLTANLGPHFSGGGSGGSW